MNPTFVSDVSGSWLIAKLHCNPPNLTRGLSGQTQPRNGLCLPGPVPGASPLPRMGKKPGGMYLLLPLLLQFPLSSHLSPDAPAGQSLADFAHLCSALAKHPNRGPQECCGGIMAGKRHRQGPGALFRSERIAWIALVWLDFHPGLLWPSETGLLLTCKYVKSRPSFCLCNTVYLKKASEASVKSRFHSCLQSERHPSPSGLFQSSKCTLFVPSTQDTHTNTRQSFVSHGRKLLHVWCCWVGCSFCYGKMEARWRQPFLSYLSKRETTVLVNVDHRQVILIKNVSQTLILTDF